MLGSFNTFLLCLALMPLAAFSQQPRPTGSSGHALIFSIPRLEIEPVIDGNLDEWKDAAYSDGVWDLNRVSQSSWYDPKRNRLTNEGEDVSIEDDLSARYYMAWDNNFLYLGAEAHDNVNDVIDSKHAPKRWYYKDAIAWFIEAPGDSVDETFGEGDHAFAFVIDTSMPDYGAWWRHGTSDTTYIEQPLPHGTFSYSIRMNPRPTGSSGRAWDSGDADYILEARIDLHALLPRSDPHWKSPEPGDIYRMMIVHCDPDGGEYGGHLLIYGRDDNDSSWTKMILTESVLAPPVFNVGDYGARGDTTELATAAIQQAIDVCHEAGGGTVYFPPGDYLSGTIVLKDNVTLGLEAGATLFASRHAADYIAPRQTYMFPALIYAYQARNIGITGHGTIHGQAGRVYEDLKKVDAFIDTITENARRAGVEMKMYYRVPPDYFMVFFDECEGITIKDISMIESQYWTCHMFNSAQIFICGVRINSNLERGVNADGIVINACHDVMISDCHVVAGDDAIVLKSWYTFKQGCENVMVTNCTLSSSSTALKIGTETHGNFRNIMFSNCVIKNSNRGLSIVVRDSGSVNNVLFSNITIECNRRHFNWWGNADPIYILLKNRKATTKTGSISNIVFENIIAHGRGTSRIESHQGKGIENIQLRNVQFFMSEEDYLDKRADHAFYASNVKNLTLDSVSVSWDTINTEPKWASALFIQHVDGLTIRNFRGRQGLIGSDHPVIYLKDVRQRKVKNVVLDDGAAKKLRVEK